MEIKETLYTIRQVARRLNYSQRQIRQMCTDGKIAGAYKLPGGGKWLIPESRLAAIAKREQEGYKPRLEYEQPYQRALQVGERRTRSQAIAVSRERIAEIKSLAKKLEWRTWVLEPDRRFNPSSRQAENEIIEAAVKGDTHPFLSAMITAGRAPWWCEVGPVQIRRHLSWRDSALLDELLGMPESDKLRTLLPEWEEKVEKYRKLKEIGAKRAELEQAYKEAVEVTERLHSELWRVVVSLG